VTFEEFAEARLQTLLNFSAVLTNDRALGEDLVQDVLMRAEGQWGRIGTLDQPLAYVRRMLVNEFVSWRRKWARIVPRSDVAALVESPGVDYASRYAERSALADEIARLSPKQRAVIVLRYYEDLPDDEIAEWLGCSPNTVRVHALRALRSLRVASDDSPSRAPTRRT
jgi:RNA polymerase sigma-70 factor (sigma-E family)